MIDINGENFAQQIEFERGTVGVFGYGYVGQAVAYFFQDKFNVKVYDKAKTDVCHHPDEVVRDSELIFVCVPTPMGKDGSCHTVIVEDVLAEILWRAQKINRPLSDFIVVIKSTIKPGFTETMKKRFPGMRIVFSPEFLTEKNSIQDFKNTNRIVIGGDEKDAEVVCHYFLKAIPERVEDGSAILVQCSPTVAEMVKLYTNGILMTKILFSNEIHQMCEKLKIPYEEVRVLATLDTRIGSSHTSVPGHDGKFGAGGSCFPKDINNLRATARDLGISEKIFSAVIQRNEEIRGKDWEELKGRAVID